MPASWQFIALDIAGLVKVVPPTFSDARGFFRESWNDAAFARAGIDLSWYQENHSRSLPGVLRGLHYQLERSQGKLVRVARGRILDVAVDMRAQSATLGQHCAVSLDADEGAMLWIPPGFAHGFLVTGDEPADVVYLCTAAWDGNDEQVLAWDDPDLAINWPNRQGLILSERDQTGMSFAAAPRIPGIPVSG